MEKSNALVFDTGRVEFTVSIEDVQRVIDTILSDDNPWRNQSVNVVIKDCMDCEKTQGRDNICASILLDLLAQAGVKHTAISHSEKFNYAYDALPEFPCV